MKIVITFIFNAIQRNVKGMNILKNIYISIFWKKSNKDKLSNICSCLDQCFKDKLKRQHDRTTTLKREFHFCLR